MSHALLLSRNVPLVAQDHERLARERLAQLRLDHAKRIQNIKFERDIIMGNVWEKPVPKGTHRLTDTTGHEILTMAAALLLPKPPRLNVLPLGDQPEDQEAADGITKWDYAALYNLNAEDSWRALAKEECHGVGFVHLLPDKLAIEDREVPVILDVPQSENVLYHQGPRGRMDYAFIRYQMTVRDVFRYFNTRPNSSYTNESQLVDVYVYYCEERYKDPRTGKTNLMVLMSVMEREKFMFPLQDATAILSRIPIMGAFNSDGYNWRGVEHMRALGILTPHHQKLLYFSDMLTSLANGTMRYVQPPLFVQQEEDSQEIQVDLRPGGVTYGLPTDQIKAMLDTAPSAQTYAFLQQLKDSLGDATVPQIQSKAKDFDGASGSMLAELQQAVMVRNNVRQWNLRRAIEDTVSMLNYHVASISDDGELSMVGINPHNHEVIRAAARPIDLMLHHQVYVELPFQMPRGALQYATQLMNAARDGFLPNALVSEQLLQLLDLPIYDMTTLSQQIAADQYYKVKLQMLAKQAVPEMYRQMYQQGQNPAILDDGAKPYNLSSEGQDPRLLEGITAGSEPHAGPGGM